MLNILGITGIFLLILLLGLSISGIKLARTTNDKKINLLGCDCNYIEIVEGAKLVDHTLVIVDTPQKNLNYWFDDYPLVDRP